MLSSRHIIYDIEAALTQKRSRPNSPQNTPATTERLYDDDGLKSLVHYALSSGNRAADRYGIRTNLFPFLQG